MNREKEGDNKKQYLRFASLFLSAGLFLSFSTAGLSQPKSDYRFTFALAHGSRTSVLIPNRAISLRVLNRSMSDEYSESGIIREFSASPTLARSIRPPANAGRILGEFVVGIGAAIGLSIATFSISGVDMGGMWLFLSAYPMGATLGVYAIGSLGDETGSILATLLGSIVGMGMGLAIPTFIAISNDDLADIPFLLGAPVGACLGFNLTRRYKGVSTQAALLNFKDGRLRLDIPRIRLQASEVGRSGFALSLDILNLEL